VRADHVALGQLLGDGQRQVLCQAPLLVDLGQLGELVGARGGALFLLSALLLDVGLCRLWRWGVRKRERER
jgi:hypothetical protein